MCKYRVMQNKKNRLAKAYSEQIYICLQDGKICVSGEKCHIKGESK